MTGAIVVPSPDERYIAIAGNGMDLWVYDTADKKWANLGKVTIHDTNWDYIRPSWNPWFADSSRLAFFPDRSLIIASPDGKQRQLTLVSTDAAALAVAWADESRVAYVTFAPRPMKLRPDLEFWCSSTIWAVPVTGGQPLRITTTAATQRMA